MRTSLSQTLGGPGSTTQLADATGTVTDSYTYDAFGTLRSSTGTTPNAFKFTGEQHEATSRGLYYLRARHYDPALGRFLTQDPLPFEQQYAYVGNNPVNYVDPLGLCGWRDPWNCADEAAEEVVEGVSNVADAVAPYVSVALNILNPFSECHKLVAGALVTGAMTVAVGSVFFGAALTTGVAPPVAVLIGVQGTVVVAAGVGATAGIGYAAYESCVDPSHDESKEAAEMEVK